MQPFLPQQDPHPIERRHALLKRQAVVQYDHGLIAPLGLVKQVPDWHQPSDAWWKLVGEKARDLLRNAIAVRRGQRTVSYGLDGDPMTERLEDSQAALEKLLQETSADAQTPDSEPESPSHGPVSFGLFSAMQDTLAQVSTLMPALRSVAQQQVARTRSSLQNTWIKTLGLVVDDLTAALVHGEARSLHDYEALYRTVPLPEVYAHWQSDHWFARMRLAGPNPIVLSRLEAPLAHFPVTDQHYQATMGPDDSLALALQQGRLYLADYAVLAGAIPGVVPGYAKYLHAPLALFAVPRAEETDRSLRPVAIQVGQRPGPDNPIVTPQDEALWAQARLAVQTADGNHHEAVAHLGRTHLLIEPFVVATERQLADAHPLALLLKPHFEGTLFINNAAQAHLVSSGGTVERLLAGTLEFSRMAAVSQLIHFPFDHAALPTQLALRGVADPSCLPDYPYRDDGLLLWEVIGHWVSDYLHHVYVDDGAVQQDEELQAWVAELTSPLGGNVTGFGQEGRIRTRAYLIDAVTTLIFTASAQHAAVNFPQYDVMGYAPAMPLANYAPALKTPTEEGVLAMLPPLDQALVQADLGYLLGSLYYSTLGTYPADHFTDPYVQRRLETFRQQLACVEETILRRNQRREPYTHLLPSKVPQSINI